MTRSQRDLQPQRGDVYLADLGLEELKRVAIVSADEFNLNRAWRKVICVYLTSKRSPGGPWVPLGGRHEGTLANCTEIFPLDKDDLVERMPSLSGADLIEVYRGIALALGAERVYEEIYGKSGPGRPGDPGARS